MVAAVIALFSAHFNRYYLGLAIDVAINIILAVSLNLINGHTGQFSLGHAGFMAVGGYTAAKLSLVLQPLIPPWAQPVLFLAGLLLGGLIAAATAARGWCSHAATARRLSCHRDARLWRNHPRRFSNHRSIWGGDRPDRHSNWTNFGWAWAGAAWCVLSSPVS